MTDFNKDKITIIQFCDVQGISQADRFSLFSSYKEYAFYYEDWYEMVSEKIRLSEKKIFNENSKNSILDLVQRQKISIEKILSVKEVFLKNEDKKSENKRQNKVKSDALTLEAKEANL